MVVFSQRLNSVILEVFSNLIDPVILCFRVITAVPGMQWAVQIFIE